MGGSSQEEYEESESESDRLMTSSNEGILSSASESGRGRGGAGSGHEEDGEDEDEEDESATALGVGVASEPASFTPQPNAFTRPPASQTRHHSSVPGSYFPATSRPGATSQRHSYPGQPHRQHHSPYNALAPAHQPDHEAALRASLNTLLSCAAAARGLPKKGNVPSRSNVPAAGARVEASTLRMVPESVALGLDRPSLQGRRASSTPSSSNSAPSPAAEVQAQESSERSKRKATGSSTKDRQRVAKKPRRLVGEESISPTLLTWVVSAGVLVLVSALSFSAGYKVGRESARLDGLSGGDASCAREAGRSGLGLRRLQGATIRT